MPHEPAQPASPTPVFSDPSGRRASLLRRVSWALCVAFVATLGAVAFTLVTQVPLPGLGGLLPTPPEASAPRVQPSQVTDGDRQAGEGDGAGTLTTAELDERLSALARPVRDRLTPAPGSSSGAPGQSSSAPVPDHVGPAPHSGTPGIQAPGGGTPGTPSPNANPQATTKTRNPQAAEKKPSPRVVRSPDEHAAAGRGNASGTDSGTDSGAAAAPGRTK